MYSEIYKKKVNHAGVARETENYILYEYVDEIEKYRKMQAQKAQKAQKATKVQKTQKAQKSQKAQKQQILKAEPRTKQPKDLLDNYRYYEDMNIKDPRHKGSVKHKRNSKPHGKETPFNRDSYKKLTTFSPNPRSSYERNGIYDKKNDSKNITVNQAETIYAPRRNKALRSKPYQTETNYSPRRNETLRNKSKQSDNYYSPRRNGTLKSKPNQNETYYSPRRNETLRSKLYQTDSYYSPRRNETLRRKPSDYYPTFGCEGLGYNYKQNDILEKRRPEDTYNTAKHGKHCILRQLHFSPQNGNYYATKSTYLRGGRKDSYDSYMKPYSHVYEDSDFNYQYKESVNIKRPKRRESKTYHIKKTQRSYSGGRSKVDGRFNSYNDYY